MKTKDIKKNLNRIINDSTPEVYDQIDSKCKEKNMEVIYPRSNKKNVFRYAYLFVLVFFIFTGLLGVKTYKNMYKVSSVIGIDVNPSLEIKLNDKNKVIDIISLNEEARKILADMDLKKVDINVAINAIVGSMFKNGYLNIDSNSILVSVNNSDKQKSDKIKTMLTKKIEETFKNNSLNGNIISQVINEESFDKNTSNNISDGKYLLIKKVLATDIKDRFGNSYNFDTLSQLSINELNILLLEKDISVKDISTSGSVSKTGYITREKAKEIILNHAKINNNNVNYFEIEFDYDYNKLIYEIEFKYDKYEYSYDVNAKTGEIIKVEKEMSENLGDISVNNDNNNLNNSNLSNSYITKEKAKMIAFNHAKISVNQVKDLEIELDDENDIKIYSIDFKVNNVEYEYEINAITGKIIKVEKEKDN